MSERTLIVARDAASKLGCSPRTVRELARRGLLPAVRFGERGHLRFRPEDVERLLQPRRKRAA